MSDQAKTTGRAIEDDLKLAERRSYSGPHYLTVRPCAGNGAIITTTAKGDIRLTEEERRRVAAALWPDAFK
jgi:hypothetical protein